MFDTIMFRDYAEMVDNVLTSDETLCAKNLKGTISSTGEIEDAETEVLNSMDEYKHGLSSNCASLSFRTTDFCTVLRKIRIYDL